MATPPSPPAAPNRLTMTDTVYVTTADAMMDWFAEDMADEFDAFGDEVVTEAASYFLANSSSSVSVGTGTKNFTIEAAKAFRAGQWVEAHDAADPATNYMLGQVTSYDTGTGALVLSVPANGYFGSGTKTDWDIYLGGKPAPSPDALPSLSANAGKVLAVNSGASAAEWINHGGELIQTASPSAASSVSFTSISTGFADLILMYSLTSSAAANLRVEVSTDGSSWSTALAFTSSTTTRRVGGVRFDGRNYDYGGGYLTYAENATPSLSVSLNGASGGLISWCCPSGIKAIRITPASGTITGTVSLYGRR